jgi:hypothetical protein
MKVFKPLLCLSLSLCLFNYSCKTEKNVVFTKQYILDHKGQYEVAIPEVHELANILVALSNVGRIDSNMVDMTTAYYQKVLQTFRPFSSHPILDTINAHIISSNDANSYWYYYALKMNACGYAFIQDNSIYNTGPIKKMGFDNMKDPIRNNIALIEDFSNKSGFREFYAQNKSYYDSLLATYRQLNPIDKMQKWLVSKFGISYDNYVVYFSPLVGGAHATQKYKDNNFEQTAMFVCRSPVFNDYNMNVNEMINSRVVFTEIDHNFVNPISDRYRKKINKAFAKRAEWVNDFEGSKTQSYNTPYAIFNEYMTFAIFSLYCYDLFPESDVAVFIPKMEKQMAEKRHFIKFKEFNQKLISIYKENKNSSIYALYDQMLNWCETL